MSTIFLAVIFTLAISCSPEPNPEWIEGERKGISAFQVTDTSAIDTSIWRATPQEDIGCTFYDSAPVEIHRVTPQYPEVHLNERGKVWVKSFVDSTGRITYAYVLKSENIVFNRPALQAMIQWRFKPAVLNGRQVGTWMSLPFRFQPPPEKLPE